jgi:putative membrane protein
MIPEKYREWITVYLKGLAMGTADAIPGVSGGTIALITGIYERLIDALTQFNPSRFYGLTQNFFRREFSEVKNSLLEMDVPFLAVLVAGIFTAVILVLNFVHVLLSRFPVQTYGFFFGLIGLSAVVLYEEIDVSTHRRKLAGLAGFLAAFLASGYGAGSLGHELPVLFFSGMIAVSAMVLPGISGSLFLVILGQYEYISGALSEFTDAALSFVTTGNFEQVVSASPPILVFVSGAFVGLFTVVHVVERSLASHRQATMVLLVSMILGALRAPVIQVEKYLAENSLPWVQILPEFAISAAIGAAAIYVIHSKTGEI